MLKTAWIVAVVAILIVFFAQARPQKGDLMVGADAIGSLSAINKAQRLFASSIGSGGYAATLAKLKTPCVGWGAGFIGADLGTDPTILKSGYEIRLHLKPGAEQAATDCDGAATYRSYYATATPRPHVPGRRAFATDETGGIWADASGQPLHPPFKDSMLVGGR